MSIVLKNQLEASEKSVGELESELQRQHDRATLCRDIEDLMRSVVNLHAGINMAVEHWQDAIASGDASLGANKEEAACQWDEIYRRLAGVFEKTARMARTLEGTGFVIAGKPEFINAWRALRQVVCFSRQRIARAIDQVRRGETRSLGEISNELSR